MAELHLETFRRHFPIPIKRVIVTDRMSYILQGTSDAAIRMAKYCEAKAQKVIIDNRLPLEASVCEWKIKGIVIEISMTIQYVPEMDAIPAY